MAVLLLIILLYYLYNTDKVIKELKQENKELKAKLAKLADLDKVIVSEREITENNVQVKSVETKKIVEQKI